MPDQEKERKMTATSGRKCLGELTKSDPIGLLVKTLLESQAWYSPVMKLKWKVTRISKEKVTWRRKCVSNLLLTESATTSKVSVIPSSRLLYQLVPSVRRIEGTESGLLPTVQTQGLKVCNKGKTEFMNLKLLPTPQARDFRNGSSLTDGRMKRKQVQGWTMNLNDMAKSGLLPTPIKSYWKAGTPKDRNDGKTRNSQLNHLIAHHAGENFPSQSPVCCGDDGLPSQLSGITFSKHRAESIKAYGNSMVPQLVYQIFKAIGEVENLLKLNQNKKT